MTNYDVIFDKFIKKLRGDTSIFNYKYLSEAEINELVEEHLTSLLSRAVDKIYECGLPDINLHDRDDVLQTFNDELVPQEIALLSDVMYICYLNEDLNKLKAVGTFFRTSEIEMFSPANERKSYLSLVEKVEQDILNSIVNYLSRDRLTWNFKSIYGGN